MHDASRARFLVLLVRLFPLVPLLLLSLHVTSSRASPSTIHLDDTGNPLSVSDAPHVPYDGNLCTRLVLHAVEGHGVACSATDPCPGPTTTVPAGTPVTVYLFARGYENIIVLQTAFGWEDWIFVDGRWDCQPLSFTVREPGGAGGPDEGTLEVAFDCLIDGASELIGSMEFLTTGSGCLSQVDSSWPLGTHVARCAFPHGTTPIPSVHRGAVCVNAPGLDVCEPENPAPICEAGGPYAADPGEVIDFDGEGSSDPEGAIVAYLWEFGDGGTAFGSTPGHAYEATGLYTVTLCVTDDDCNEVCCATAADINAVASMSEAPEVPANGATGRIALGPARPNPLRATTSITFDLPASTGTRLRVYDATGRLVRVLMDAVMSRGSHTVHWDGRDQEGERLRSGIYVVRLEAGSQTVSRKIVVMK